MIYKFVFSFVLLLISTINVNAEIIGDSIVAIYNNWRINEEATYQSYSSRTIIQGNDSTTTESPSGSLTILLKDTLPNSDLLFETKMQMPPLGEHGEFDKMEPLRKFFERYNEVLKRPYSFLTDTYGVIKEICNYDLIREEVDSCFLVLQDIVHTLDISEDQKNAITSGFNNIIQQSLSKESLQENAGIFKHYGLVYNIGTTSEKVKMPIPFFNNKEIDADLTYTCDILEKTEESEVISIRTDAVYDSDQLTNLIATTLLTDDQQRKSGMLNSDRPYIYFSQTEEYIIEVLSGTILQVETEKRTVSPDKSRIDYSIIQLTDFQ